MRHQTTHIHLCPHQSVHTRTYCGKMPLYVQDQCIHTAARCHCTYNFPAELSAQPHQSLSHAISSFSGSSVRPFATDPHASSINDLACGVHLRSLREFFNTRPHFINRLPRKLFTTHLALIYTPSLSLTFFPPFRSSLFLSDPAFPSSAKSRKSVQPVARRAG